MTYYKHLKDKVKTAQCIIQCTNLMILLTVGLILIVNIVVEEDRTWLKNTPQQ